MNNRTGHVISAHYLDALKGAIDPIELVGRYTQLRPAGKSHTGCCPFHDEKTPSFHVYPDGGYKCWGGSCEASGGDVISFLREAEGIEFLEAVERLSAEAGMEVPRPESNCSPEEGKMFQALQDAVEWYQGALKFFPEATAYMVGRKIGREAREKSRLGYAPKKSSNLDPLIKRHGLEVFKSLGLMAESQKQPGTYYPLFRDRLIIPVLNQSGKAIGLVGRALNDAQKAKYLTLNTPFFKRNRDVYGEHLNGDESDKAVCVAEGPLDAIIVNQEMGHSVRAPLGTKVTPDQITRIIRGHDRVDVLMDGDRPGRLAGAEFARTIAGLLTFPLDVGFVPFPPGEDPASWLTGSNEAGQLERLDLAELLIRSGTAMFDLESWLGQAQAAAWLADTLPKSPAGPAVEVLRARYANAIGVPVQAVEKRADE